MKVAGHRAGSPAAEIYLLRPRGCHGQYKGSYWQVLSRGVASPTLLLHSGQNGLEGSCVNLSHAAIVVAQVKDAGG